MVVEPKIKQIPEYKEGEIIIDVFAVRFKKPIKPTVAKKYWFELKLQDSGGDIMLKFWGGSNMESVQAIYDSIRPDSIIKVENGSVDSYNQRLNFSVNEGTGSIRVLKEGEYDVKDFVKISKKDPEELWSSVMGMLEKVKSPELRKIIDAFVKDEDFVGRFKESPGAMYKHHGWVSGLLEHTESVMSICYGLSEKYNLDGELLLVGAFLHDIGKMKEFETTVQIKVSDKGNLLGHIPLGIQMLTEKLAGVEIPEELKDKLVHLIVSHHGKAEWGSPKEPGFPEAMVLHLVDLMDAWVMQMNELKEGANTEDSFLYIPDFGNIYLK